MGLRHSQRGLGLVGGMYLAFTMGVIAIVAVKSLPVYTNHMAIKRAARNVANDLNLANAGLMEVRSALQRYWDIDDIRHLATRDVKVKKGSSGRSLAYEYQARIHLFYNVDLVYSFAEELPMRTVGS